MLLREATPLDAGLIAKVHVDAWRSTYRGIISDAFLEGLSYSDRESMWNSALMASEPKCHVYVIESDEGQLVGFVAAGLEREKPTGEKGEIYAIYLLKQYQARGWGKQLFLKAADRLKQDGCKSLMLWVLCDNPTRGFYESLKGRVSKQRDIEIGGNTLVEVAYEWERIDRLLA